MKRYIFQKSSTRPDGWVLTDTEHGIVLTFEDGRFNETQKVTVLEDVPQPSADELARIMRELGDWAARHHGSKCFSQPYGFEFSEDDTKCHLYRRKPPRWRLEIEDSVDAGHLAATLCKAAEFLTKRADYER